MDSSESDYGGACMVGCRLQCDTYQMADPLIHNDSVEIAKSVKGRRRLLGE